MSNDQMGDVLYFVFFLAGLVWRFYSARNKNTPETTKVRLTNGHIKDIAKSGISTDEMRRFIDSSTSNDESRDARLASHERNLSILTERFLSTQDRLIEFDRRLFQMENGFQQTLATLARIEASQSSVNQLLTNLYNKGGIVQ